MKNLKEWAKVVAGALIVLGIFIVMLYLGWAYDNRTGRAVSTTVEDNRGPVLKKAMAEALK